MHFPQFYVLFKVYTSAPELGAGRTHEDPASRLFSGASQQKFGPCDPAPRVTVDVFRYHD